MSDESIFRVIFLNQNDVFEVYARQIYQSEMFGFVEVEEFVFGERAQVVVDPSEERLKAQFSDVKRTYVPMHSIIRIDEVEKEGVGKVTSIDGGNVARFPGFNYGSGKKPSKD